MENESRFCPECGTENEAKYEYCKNCGALLLDPTPTEQSFVQQPNTQQFYENPSPYRTPEGYAPQNNTVYNNTQQNYRYEESNVDKEADINNVTFFGGVSVEEAGAFIGKKAAGILPKFKKMEYSGGKVTWCWPVAVLSYILGPLGAALWFLYRKMYKLGWLFLAGAVIFASVQTVVTFSLESIDIDDIGKQITDITSVTEVEDYMESFEGLIDTLAVNEDNIRYSLISMFFDLFANGVHIATTALCGMFAFYWYKKHTVNEILKFRNSNADMRYYQIGLMTKGGTGGGMVALGIVLYSVVVTAVTVALYLLFY